MHIRPISFQKLDHFDISMQCSKMQRSESIAILMINPSLELNCKRSVCFIIVVIGFKVQDINLHFRELVFKCCKMQKCRLIFLPHYWEIQFRSLLKITSKIVIRFDIHNEVDGFVLLCLALFLCAHVRRIIFKIWY